jgi:hypothetical protein
MKIMGRIENFRAYAVDCMHRAEAEQTVEEKNILLNLALAWVRLAQQSQTAAESTGLPVAEKAEPPGESASPAA